MLSDNEIVDRDVEVAVSVGTIRDPRELMAGMPDASAVASRDEDPDADNWLGGLFDRGSWKESLAGWAKTVVVGRARLGGIPVGVIVTETRTVERTTPADPAVPESGENVVQQAGQVFTELQS